MADTFLSEVASISAPSINERGQTPSGREGTAGAVATVRFRNGETARVSTTHPWHLPRLETYKQLNRPLSLEVSGGLLVDVTVPVVGRVHSLAQEGSNVRILMDGAAQPLILPAGRQDLLSLLENALRDQTGVAISTTSACGSEVKVQDVSRANTSTAVAVEEFDSPTVMAPVNQVDRTRAEDAFRTIRSSRSALPPRKSDGGIPFQYPHNGCWVIAQSVAKALDARNLVAGKVWLLPRAGQNLTCPIDLTATCSATWGFHVATVLGMSSASPNDRAALWVLDPISQETVLPLDSYLSRVRGVDTWMLSTANVYTLAKLSGRLVGAGQSPGQHAADIVALRDMLREYWHRCGPFPACS